LARLPLPDVWWHALVLEFWPVSAPQLRLKQHRAPDYFAEEAAPELDFAGRDGVPHITRSGSKQYNRADQHDQQIAVEAGARGQRSSGFCIEQVLSGKACLIVSRSRNTWRCFVRSSVRGSRFWMRLQTQLRSGRIAFAGLCLLGFFSGVQKQTHVQGFP
jgi:hypothetical protein